MSDEHLTHTTSIHSEPTMLESVSGTLTALKFSKDVLTRMALYDEAGKVLEVMTKLRGFSVEELDKSFPASGVWFPKWEPQENGDNQ